MKVLFIGGTGIISSACSELAVRRSIDLYHLNRGQSRSIRPVDGVTHIRADIRNEAETRKALQGHHFDAVVEWIAFHPDDVLRDIRLFSGITGQYIFISSASAYQTPPERWPITEETPLENPFWEYSRNKIACENALMDAWKQKSFPAAIVRPSHTYDKTLIPLEWGYTGIARIKEGRPIVVHGDGSSLWTLTHHRDFAVGLVGLLGLRGFVGQACHITSDEWLSWDRIVHILAGHLGRKPEIVHATSELIARFDPEVGSSLLGDKAHSMIFDNSRIRELVPDFRPEIPFSSGSAEIINWYEADVSRQIVNPATDALLDRIIRETRNNQTS